VARKRSIAIRFRYVLEYVIFRLLETVIRFVPARWIDSLGWWLGSLAYRLMPTRRQTVLRNLRMVTDIAPCDQAFHDITRETFSRAGANLLGGMRCMVMDDEEIARHVSVEGADLVRETLRSQSQGAVFALSHMGNWEILARITALVSPGTPAGAFYRPLNNPWMNRMTRKRRQQSGTQLFSSKESFSRSCQLLREGGMLGILADQNAGKSGCLTSFFGRPTSCSPLPELLQRRTGAALFYVAMTRDAPAHWQIRITRHDPQQAISTRSIMQGVEQALALSPADGFWLHDRWKLATRLPLATRQSRTELDHRTITKPWRYALVISATPAIAKAAAPAIDHLIHSLPQAEIHQIHAAADLDLSTTLIALDQQKNYPLDLVIYFCPELAHQSPHRHTSIDMAAGFGKSQPSLPCAIPPPSTAMDDPQTWFHLIQSLGCPAPVPSP